MLFTCLSASPSQVSISSTGARAYAHRLRSRFLRDPFSSAIAAATHKRTPSLSTSAHLTFHGLCRRFHERFFSITKIDYLFWAKCSLGIAIVSLLICHDSLPRLFNEVADVVRMTICPKDYSWIGPALFSAQISCKRRVDFALGISRISRSLIDGWTVMCEDYDLLLQLGELGDLRI